MQLDFEKETQWLLKEKYHGEASLVFQRDVQRLQAGEPIDYVIGWKDFLGCAIDLSRRPLIPRPETEYWVERVGKEIRAKKRRVRVLDLFAGSGCIGIALLKYCPKQVAHCDFGEKDASLCKQIASNCKLNAVAKKSYRIIQSDVFSRITGMYDYICANPPYIAKTKQRRVQKSVLQYEPPRALFAGNDGLAIVKRFLKYASKFLNARGSIVMEFDSWQKPLIASMLKRLGYKQWAFHKDQFGKWRWVEIHTDISTS
ncbi:MAG: hypothetical protein CO102_02125 [Candidatus Brennerbacteria bacterium CG_4_9_14_3_um_filter_43_9]|uniref:peptide chain release factor N(5)-glutamine methyltransferase n=1 Tax=Candidatus Brennerbacteria bacterium CG_4_9_14_3_um_filter_43_9 TaxID=1974522 RepID=A0A2M8C1V5_9BACT|nr:MAG: hypothetical protein CO102_02125 [Candidatus Brennerbacteria bacterium CG_4_9_14_3_um_filter_43_9]